MCAPEFIYCLHMKKCLHNRVHDYRIKKNITQEELARAVCVTRQTIIAIEKGNYTPSVGLALHIAMYFKTPTEDLFYFS